MESRTMGGGAQAILGLCLALALACSATGCGTKGLRLADGALVAPPAATDTQPPAAGAVLPVEYAVRMHPQASANPPFSAGAARLGSALNWPADAKHASYTPEDLVKDGAAYEPPTMPQHRIAAQQPSALFSPVNAPGTPAILEELAYATYAFQLSGYDGAATVGVYWDSSLAPEAADGFWLGLANRERGRWDWYAGPQDAVLTVASLEPYLEAPSGRLLLVVLALGDQACSLRRLQIGAPELRATGATNDPGQLTDHFPPFAEPLAGLPSAVDLSAGCAAVQDQGAAASGTAFASAAGAYNYELKRLYGADGWDFADPSNCLSPKYMYLQTGQDQGLGCPDEGRSTSLALDWLLANGCATEQSAPYADLCDADWGQAALDDAALLDPEKLFQIDPRGHNGLAKIKHILAVQQVPLLLRIKLDPAFFQYYSGAWDFQGPAVANHTLLIVGYDDGIQALKVRNSWGAGWGEDGYCWIGYNTTRYTAWDTVPWCWVLYDDYTAAAAARFCESQAVLLPPADVQAADGVLADRVTVTWEKSAGATGYALYRDDRALPVSTLGDVSTWEDSANDAFTHVYWVQALGAVNSDLSAPDLGYFAQSPLVYGVDPVHGISGHTVQFSASASGSTPLQYAWYFNGGTVPVVSDKASPEVTLGAPGVYRCTLDVTNACGTQHVEFALTVGQRLYILPDPADADWSVVTGAGNPALPYILDPTDYSREYSLAANTQPDGSGTWIDPAGLSWVAFPGLIAHWTTPGSFSADQFTVGYVYAESADPLRCSNYIYIRMGLAP